MVSSQALLFLPKRIKQADFSVEATLRNPHFYNCSARIVGMDDGLSYHSLHSPTPTNQPPDQMQIQLPTTFPILAFRAVAVAAGSSWA